MNTKEYIQKIQEEQKKEADKIPGICFAAQMCNEVTKRQLGVRCPIICPRKKGDHNGDKNNTRELQK